MKMKKVSLLILVSMILLLAFTSCDLIPMSVQTAVGLHKHEWTEATCEAPKTCAGCKATEGEALGHDWAEATCTTPKTCKVCAATEGDVVAHDYAPATCTTPKTCKGCGAKMGKALGHEWNNPTCTEAKTCTVCKVTEGAAKGHTEATKEENRVEATCTEDGSYDLVTYCSVCKVELNRETKKINALKHDWDDGVVTTLPTCSSAGVKTFTCKNDASHTYTEDVEIDSEAHKWNAGEVVNEPTCSAEGLKVYTCEHDSTHTKNETLEVVEDAHKWDDGVVTTDPTCSEVGIKTFTCTHNNAHTKTEDVAINPEAHAWNDGEVTTAPTCKAEGVKTFTCRHNGEHTYTQTVDIDPNAHKMAEATCTLPSTCEYCGHTEGTSVDHVGAEAVNEVITPPTCTDAGRHYVIVNCKWCETEMSKDIVTDEALDHDMVDATCEADAYCQREGCDYVDEDSQLKNHTVVLDASGDKLVYKCTTCSDNTFAITGQSFYFDGSSTEGLDGGNLPDKNKAYTSNDSAHPAIVQDGDNYYFEYVKQATGTDGGQLQIWLPNYGSSNAFADFNSANDSIGFVSFRINLYSDHANGFSIRLAEGNKTSGSWHSTPNGEGAIPGNVFGVSPVLSGGVVTSYNIKSWNGTFKTIGADEMEGNFTGWLEVTIGLEMDAENDMLLTHYYLGGKYQRTESVKITTEFNSIKGVYFNFNANGQGTGYKLDYVATGYTNNATWTFDTCEHTYGEPAVTAPTCTEDGYKVYTCSACGYKYTEAGEAALTHDMAEATCTEPATCKNGCGHTEGEPKGHDMAPATCTLPSTCKNGCGHTEGEANGHTAGTPVEDNRKDSTCYAEGSYDEVVYCSVCLTHEISRTTKTIEKKEHTPANAVVENNVNPTCTTTGSYESVVYCSVAECKHEISRTSVTVKANGHTPGEAVKENEDEDPATCTTPGSYESVVYCSVETCKAELSRDKVSVNALGHPDVTEYDEEPATCVDDGTGYGKYCNTCKTWLDERETLLATGSHTDDDSDNICDVCEADLTLTCTHEGTTQDRPGYASTCTTPGLTDGEWCTACNTWVTPQTARPLVEHSYGELHAEVAAGCETNGNIAYYQCSVCSKYFNSDKEEVETVVTNMTGHNYGAFEYVEGSAECGVDGQNKAVCANGCGIDKFETATGTALQHVYTSYVSDNNAKCGVDGTKTATCDNGCGTTDTVTEEGTALDHVYTKYVSNNDAECGVDGTKTATCDHGCGTNDTLTDEGTALTHVLSCTVAESVVTYTCTACEVDFAITEQGYYFDGSSEIGSSHTTSKGNAYTSDDDNAPEIITDEATGNKYYQYSKQETTTSNGQLELWVPNHGNSDMFTGFKSSNDSIGFISFKINAYTDNKDAGLVIRLAEGVKSYVDSQGVTQSNWYGSPLGAINDNGKQSVFTITPVLTEGVVTGYDVKSWSGKILKTISTEEMDGSFTGWMNVTIGLVMDEENDMLITHYYLGGEYVLTDSVEITTEKNMIAGVYLNFGAFSAGTGYMLDDLAVGYTNNAEWLYDTCEHTYGDSTHVDATCEGIGYDQKVCTACGHRVRWDVVSATGHDADAYNCLTDGYCTSCEQTVPATGHTVVHTYANSTLTYYCSGCGVEFSIDSEGVYYSGNSMDELVAGTYYPGSGGTFNNGANTLVAENGAYKAIQDNDYDANATGASQMQWWLPYIKGNANNFSDFTVASGSIGVLSFKVNAKLTFTGTNNEGKTVTDAFSVKLVDNNWAGSNGAIDPNVFTITPTFAGGVVTSYNFQGWNADSTSNGLATVKNITPNADGWTDWVDVKIILVMNPDDETISANYYINGEYCFTGAQNFTTVANKKLSCVYINLNARNAGTGYYLKEVAFGHTINGHNVFDGKAHDTVAATCYSPAYCKTCGWEGTELLPHSYAVTGQDGLDLVYSCTNEDCTVSCDMTGYYYDEAADAQYYYNSNGTMPIDSTNYPDKLAYIFTPEVETAPEAAGQGWALNSNTKKLGAQPMFWIPAYADNDYLSGFSCENNASGYISFKLKTSMTDAYTLAIGKPRGDASHSWSTASINILSVGGASGATSITLKGGFDAGTDLGVTIPVGEDGWSDEFEVKIAIDLTEAYDMTLTYYINGVELKSFTDNLKTRTGYTIDDYMVRAIYINGWTYKANTGLILDDLMFAYTTHNTLDGREHNITPATCKVPAYCDCGWEGTELGECNYEGETTCHSKSVCTVCGTESELLAHNLAVSGYDADTYTLTYSCTNEGCEAHDNMKGYYFDGTTSPSASDTSPTSEFFADNTYKAVANPGVATNGYFDFTKLASAAADASYQTQIWVPGRNDDMFAGVEDFSCANNSVGVLSFKLKALDTMDDGVQLMLIFGEGRNSSEWGSGWETGSMHAMTLTKSGNDMQMSIGYGSSGLANSTTYTNVVPVGEWVTIEFRISLYTDDASANMIKYDVYVNGEYVDTKEGAYNVTSGEVNAFYLKTGLDTKNKDFYLDDIVLAYQADGHDLSSGEHIMTAATCQTYASCSCGWEGTEYGAHTGGTATCSEQAQCDVCGEYYGETLPHANVSEVTSCATPGVCSDCGNVVTPALSHENITVAVSDGVPSYTCSDCETTYTLSDYYYLDGSSTENIVFATGNGTTETGEDGNTYYQNIKSTNDTTATQVQTWIPVNNANNLNGEFAGFTCANNAVGLVSFRVNALSGTDGICFKLNQGKETSDWSGGPTQSGWTDNSFEFFKIAPVTSADQTTVAITGIGGKTLVADYTVDAATKWTGWIDVDVIVELFDDGQMRLTYFINDEYVLTDTREMPIWTDKIDSIYITTKPTADGEGYQLDDVIFGYTVPGSEDSAE